MTGFSEYQATRNRLSLWGDEVEAIWREAMQRTDLESLAGAQESDTSAVTEMMSQMRNRLASAVVEVGVFGSIKRGKSTLINALVGREVSPMRVTPETAVPVWIENGTPESKVLLHDGTQLSDLSIDEAQLMSTQRYRARDAQKKPFQVEHRLHVPWLPKGVRIVDTPGLDDPSLAEDYEQLTIAALERVAAAVFVLVSPPGPAGDEIRLLKTMGSRAVDKLFLVCNFYPDHWNDPDIRAEMTEYVERIVADGAGVGVDPRDIRVYPVSARNGFRAAITDDDAGLEDSGVAELRRDLEDYLTRGALERMLGFVERRVQMVMNITADTLIERRRLLSSPHLAEPARRAAEQEVARSRKLLNEIFTEIDRLEENLAPDLAAIVAEPFAKATAAITGVARLSEVEVILNRLRLNFETAASEASNRFAQRAGLEQIRLERKLYDSFGVEERLRGSGQAMDLMSIGDISPSMPQVVVDKDSVAATAAVSATIGGISLATIAGGAGMALIAAGPVGWLIGLGLGAIFGGGLGAVGARLANRDQLQAEHRQKMLTEIHDHEVRVRRAVKSNMKDWSSGLQRELHSMQAQFLGEREAELNRIQRILGDEQARQRELARIDTLLQRLRDAAP